MGIVLPKVRFVTVAIAWIFTGTLFWILFKISLFEVSPRFETVYAVILFAVYLFTIMSFLSAVIWTIAWIVDVAVDTVSEMVE